MIKKKADQSVNALGKQITFTEFITRLLVVNLFFFCFSSSQEGTIVVSDDVRLLKECYVITRCMPERHS